MGLGFRVDLGRCFEGLGLTVFGASHLHLIAWGFGAVRSQGTSKEGF